MKLQEGGSKSLNISLSNFYHLIPDPRTKGKPTLKKDYMGICILRAPDTYIQLELDIIIDIINEAVKGM